MTTPDRSDRALRRTLEHLRAGTPPVEDLALITRNYSRLEKSVVEFLRNESATQRIFWIRGNYGAGKSHSLAVVREVASGARFASSYVSLDGSGYAANHPQRVIAGLLRNLEVPGVEGGYPGVLYRLLSVPTSANELKQVIESSMNDSRNLDFSCRWILFNLVNSNSEGEGPDGRSKPQLIAELVSLLSGDTLLHGSASPNIRGAAYKLLRIAQDAVRLDGSVGLLIELDEVESLFTKLRNRRKRRGAYRVLAALGMSKGMKHTKLILAVTPDGDEWLRADIAQQLDWIDAMPEEPVGSLARSVASDERLIVDCRTLREAEVMDLLFKIEAMHSQVYGISQAAARIVKKRLTLETHTLVKAGVSPRHLIRHLVSELDANRYATRNDLSIGTGALTGTGTVQTNGSHEATATSFQGLFKDFWNWLLADFRNGQPHTYSPIDGNPRLIVHMDEHYMKLRETTHRQGLSLCPKSELRSDFRKLHADSQIASKSPTAGRTEYGIRNWLEFKRDMYIREFLEFSTQNAPMEQISP